MRKTVAFLLIVFTCYRLTAQPVSEKDSLQQAYQSEKNDSIKIWKHLEYIRALISSYEHSTQSLDEIEILK